MDNATNNVDLTKYRERYSQYARRLLSDLGLGDLPEPERGRLLMALEANVQQVLLNTLLENLDDNNLEDAETIIDRGGTQEEVIIYLMGTIPAIEEQIADALIKMYARLLEESKQLAQAVAGKYTTNHSPTAPPALPTTSE